MTVSWKIAVLKTKLKIISNEIVHLTNEIHQCNYPELEENMIELNISSLPRKLKPLFQFIARYKPKKYIKALRQMMQNSAGNLIPTLPQNLGRCTSGY